MSPTPASLDAARVTAARERVVRLLTDRYADDTLTVEEFEAELDRLHATTDAAELERMADALTSGVRPAAARAAGGFSPAQPATPHGIAHGVREALGWQRGVLVPARVADAGRVVAVLSASHRAGPWAVPRLLHVWAVMSEAVVDLRDAVLPAEGCEIEVGAVMANVRILLPPGVEAEVDVMAFLGAAKDDTRALGGGASGPRVRVRGSSVMAEVTVFGA